jgi:hypothetical protein
MLRIGELAPEHCSQKLCRWEGGLDDTDLVGNCRVWKGFIERTELVEKVGTKRCLRQRLGEPSEGQNE